MELRADQTIKQETALLKWDEVGCKGSESYILTHGEPRLRTYWIDHFLESNDSIGVLASESTLLGTTQIPTAFRCLGRVPAQSTQ